MIYSYNKEGKNECNVYLSAIPIQNLHPSLSNILPRVLCLQEQYLKQENNYLDHANVLEWKGEGGHINIKTSSQRLITEKQHSQDLYSILLIQSNMRRFQRYKPATLQKNLKIFAHQDHRIFKFKLTSINTIFFLISMNLDNFTQTHTHENRI